MKFYYEQVLGKEKFFIDLPHPKMPSQLPKHISVRDVKKLFDAISNIKTTLRYIKAVQKNVNITYLQYKFSGGLIWNKLDVYSTKMIENK